LFLLNSYILRTFRQASGLSFSRDYINFIAQNTDLLRIRSKTNYFSLGTVPVIYIVFQSTQVRKRTPLSSKRNGSNTVVLCAKNTFSKSCPRYGTVEIEKRVKSSGIDTMNPCHSRIFLTNSPVEEGKKKKPSSMYRFSILHTQHIQARWIFA